MSEKTEHELEMEETARLLAKAIDAFTPDGCGFTLMLYDFGGPGKFMTWISNGQREDMMKALDEFKARLQHGMADSKGDA